MEYNYVGDLFGSVQIEWTGGLDDFGPVRTVAGAYSGMSGFPIYQVPASNTDWVLWTDDNWFILDGVDVYVKDSIIPRANVLTWQTDARLGIESYSVPQKVRMTAYYLPKGLVVNQDGAVTLSADTACLSAASSVRVCIGGTPLAADLADLLTPADIAKLATVGTHELTVIYGGYIATVTLNIVAEHSPAAEWHKDETNHWHTCIYEDCDAILDQHTHTYGEWQQTLAPTCVAEGSRYKQCAICSHKVTEAIPVDVNEHAVASEWTTDGTYHWHKCTRTGCNAHVNKAEHTYGEWHETLASTCVTEGSHYKECSICEYTLVEAIPIDEDAHAPTTEWTSDGTYHWHTCTRCTVKFNEGAHTYGEWQETLASTCVAEGSHYKECSICEYTLVEAIPIDEDAHAPAAEWTGDGTYHWHACTQEGCSAELKKTAHTYNSENTCSVCGDYKDKGVKFTLSSGTYSVTDYTGSAATVIIPSAYKGVSVTSIGWEAFRDCSYLTTIILPSSITSINYGAFDNCSSLANITIPQGVISIDNYAFRNCKKLTSIILPSSLTKIGYYAFDNCSSLIDVYIADLWAWFEIDFKEGSNPLKYANNLYLDGNKLTALEIPNGITEIKSYAFSGYSALTNIVIPDSVTSIGKRAFSGCDGLVTVTFGENSKTTRIEDYAFLGCSKLTSITIPFGITVIEDGVFVDCSSLTDFGIPDSVTSILSGAFNGCTKLIQTENGVSYVDRWVVGHDSAIANVTLRSNTRGIADDVFNRHVNLVSITIPASVIFIGARAFASCSSLKSVIIVENSQLGAIRYCAFYGCSNLTSITIPASVTFIGDGAFQECSNLTDIYITDLAAWCNIKFDRSNANPLDGNKNLYLNGNKITSLEIPSGVTTIGDYAFCDWSGLTSIAMPSSVTSIGDGAFCNCSNLTSITISEGVTSIGDEAFYNCSRLVSITIPSSVTSIGEWAFLRCSGLESIIVASGNTKYRSEGNCLIEIRPCKLVLGCKNSVIPTDGSVTEIDMSAFYGCSGLTSITIPNSVTRIDSSAFGGCSSLKSVTFENTNGWQYATYYGGNYKSISSNSLANKSTAATYLTDTYVGYYWERS
ncbi:MAG: leucine-rich repeat domain-containing protein [Clostridia bacterium]|nr:leucine-rich repeat domain-containing protein [Clostridia bacterium]